MLKKTKAYWKKLEKELLASAKEKGIEESYFFQTTFHRYQMQLQIMDGLETAIEEHGPTVEKEYVKGRKNICINPAITEYNKTSNAANQTASVLLKLVQATGGEQKDEFMEFITK
jgi:hypothetical protein